MKSVNELCRMASNGWIHAGQVALDWYDIARDEHLAASDAFGVPFPELVAVSALASYNASPAMQSKIIAEWLTDDTPLPLPNSRAALDQWVRYGRDTLATSKAECYRVAMAEGSRSNAVVIDRHMLRALSSPSDELKYSSAPRGVNERYNIATDRILATAHRLGVSGCQCQALIWYEQTGYNPDDPTGLIDLRSRLGVALC
jgi:23S rRNA G2069 N7-methylase RlmK/C1962 C5-methylase RlmI